jgi:hypothetical protein
VAIGPGREERGIQRFLQLVGQDAHSALRPA